MPETRSSVPTSEDRITKESLRAVLNRSFPGASFESLEVKRIGEAYGFASRIYRCQWQDQGSLQSVVVKLWDTDSKAGLGEVLFYQKFRDLGARAPRCFYGAADAAKEKAVLVLEDLRDVLHGAELEPLDLEGAKNVARSLAGLHATWLDHNVLAELSWLQDATTWQRESDWFRF